MSSRAWKEVWKQVLSFVLAMAFVMELAPASALAAWLDRAEMEDAPVTSAETEEDAYVVGEAEELREESVKHFRMSDGSFLAVEYQTPVHYENADGTWSEIDNTLTRSGDQYVTRSGLVSRTFSATLSSGRLFETQYRDYRVGMSLVTRTAGEPAPVPTPTPTLEIAEATPGLETDAEAALQEAEREEAAEPEAAVEQAAAAEEKITAEETPAVQYSPMQLPGVKASVENPESVQRVSGKTSTEKMLAVDKLTSSVRFANALENTDLIYRNYGYNVKESVVIKRQQEAYVYAFGLHLTCLTPTLEEDGSVLLANADGEAIFCIPAPYLEDAAGMTSPAACYTLDETAGGWVLSVTADAGWLNDSARAFPVVLDPTVELCAAGTGADLSLTYTGANSADSGHFGLQTMYVGHSSGYEQRIYMGVDKLPVLPGDCQLVGAYAMLYQYKYSGSAELPIFAQQIQTKKPAAYASYKDWIRAMTWNNQPDAGLGVSSVEVLDYQKASSGKTGYLSFDITKAAQKWYWDEEQETEDETPRVVRFLTDANHTAVSYLYSYNSTSYLAPTFAIQYRNMVGLEDYYTYQTFWAGKAGTMYINDVTNTLTIERTDISAALESGTPSLTQYYASAHAGRFFSGINTCDFGSMRLGAGWKLSVQQTVVEATLGTTTYLIYTDADGTEHYFLNNGSGSYVDEDGLGLRIVKTTSGGNTIYTMTDPDAYNTWVFHNGYLISQKDNNSNTLYVLYNGGTDVSGSAWKPAAGSANRITQVQYKVNGGGTVTLATMTYSGNFMTQVTDYAGRVTKYTYADNFLKQVTYPDNSTISYEYDNASQLITACDAESSYKVTFSHHPWPSRKIHQVTEYALEGGAWQAGNSFHAYRNSARVSSYRYYGADHVTTSSIGETTDTRAKDDLVVYNVFDNYGRTITSYTTDNTKQKLLGVTAGAYTANSMTAPAKNNRLTKAASSGQHVENLLLNSGMEQTGLQNWSRNCSRDSSVTNTAQDGRYTFAALWISPHTGAQQLKAYINDKAGVAADGDYSRLRQPVALEAKTTYTFSAYVNTRTVTKFLGGGAYIAFMNEAENNPVTYQKSDVIHYNTADAIEGGWERLSVTYTPEVSGIYSLALVLEGARGIAAFDDVQLEKGDTMSSVNLLQDGSFEKSASAWWGGNLTLSDAPLPGDREDRVARGKAAYIQGATGSDKAVTQTVQINQSGETTFLLSGWGYGSSVPFNAKEDGSYERYFGLIAELKYSDGTTEKHYVPFSWSYTGWQYASGIVTPKSTGKTVSTITVKLAYNRNANEAYFDSISLIQEPVQTYTYDEKGNPVSATDAKAKTAYEYFSGTSRVKSYTTPGGTKHELVYDGNGNQQEDKLDVLTNYTYHNGAGLPTTSMTRVGTTEDFLRTKNNYDGSLLHKTSSVDANGVTTSYSYNGSYHWLSSTTNAAGVKQSNQYANSNSRLTQTYIDSVASLKYGYANGRLTTMVRKAFPTLGSTANPFEQKYTLAYDGFGNTTSVKVGDPSDDAGAITLAQYAYQSEVNNIAVHNGLLEKMTYANGNEVSYTYDLFDRKTKETYTDKKGSDREDCYYYQYDAEGGLARQYAQTNGAATESYSYEYDSLGRLIHSRENDASGSLVQRTEHMYDTSNRLTGQNWQFGDGSMYRQSYVYKTGASGDDTLRSMTTTTASGSLPVAYTYNPLRQLTSKSSGPFYRAYAYEGSSEANWKKARVQFMNYRKPDGSLIVGYKYGYDALGNISSIYKSSASGGVESPVAWTYTYDKLGQLTGVTDNDVGRTYSYTYDTAGNIRSMTGGASGNKTFTYGNAAWKDLLTKVTAGGTTGSITYEPGSGNPVTYYNGSGYEFGWTHGTQLASAKKGEATTTYAYDMAGVRSGKRVGSTDYTFTTLSGLVMRQTWNGKTLDFIYDDSNQPYAVVYHSGTGSTLYYYALNLQGDVVAILDTNGNVIARYSYDPWGVPTVYSSTGAVNTNASFIGNINPLRYRGYYYDTETGFYYLQSRYYDPQIGRFISADSYAATNIEEFLSCNMFAYCENNPVMENDATGEFSISGALIGGVTGIISAYVAGGGKDNMGALVKGGVTGFITGGIEHSIVGEIVQVGLALYEGINAGVASQSAVNGVVAFFVSFGLGQINGTNLKIFDSKLTDATLNLFSASFGFGMNMSASGIITALSDSKGSRTSKSEVKIDRRARVSERYAGMRYHVDKNGNGYWKSCRGARI